jgi:predicted DsbA family dithiol-disulfide isomerase
MKIDFVSDTVCPWCAIGLRSLEIALERLGDEVQAELRFQPFELNPHMPPEGQDIVEHLSQKYGITPQQVHASQQHVRERAAELGLSFDMRGRAVNSFDAHRLMHWAGLQGRQLELQRRLFDAYFGRAESTADHEVLTRLAAEAGLDADEARKVLQTRAYAEEVRERERFYVGRGVHSVPAVIIDDKHLLQGGHPPEVFQQALRRIAGGA